MGALGSGFPGAGVLGECDMEASPHLSGWIRAVPALLPTHPWQPRGEGKETGILSCSWVQTLQCPFILCTWHLVSGRQSLVSSEMGTRAGPSLL